MALNSRSEMSGGWEPLLHGIGFTGYRSFGSDWQPILTPSKVTVLAGQNNSGKSNVLRYVQSVLPNLKTQNGRFPKGISFSGLDAPIGFGLQTPHEFGIAIPADDDQFNNLSPQLKQSLDRVLSLSTSGYHWARFQANGDGFVPHAADAERIARDWGHWEREFRTVLGHLGGGAVDPQDVMNRMLSVIYGSFQVPDVATIVASRRVEIHTESDSKSSNGWFSGRGIVQELSKIQNPVSADWEDARVKWESINRFVQVVLGDTSARINVPHDASAIQIETPQRVLPLTNLGSGVEQVIVLAAACTVMSNTLVCIEEPETNLHPILQKKLVDYLGSNTSNQYLIATHSSHLLDHSGATVHHLTMSEGGTLVAQARLPHELVAICNDLGYRPSDLLQANCVIWVEGPSDRIYLRKWLEIFDPSLKEGIHYSIMFYGGKLLSHLSVEPEALQDFIDLRNLNRHSAILIDSDKEHSRQRVGKTKARILKEFSSSDAPGLGWVTQCYTIENYIPRDLLISAVDQVHPGRTVTGKSQQWDNPLKTVAKRTFDKIAIARAVEENLKEKHLDIWDLRKNLVKLTAFIREAQGT